MIVLSPKRITLVLLAGAIALTLLNVIRDLYRQFLGADPKFITIFAFGDKINVPTWYSSSLMLFCALLLLAIAWASRSRGDRYSLHWGLLAGVFLFLSLDEVAAIHLRIDFLSRFLPISNMRQIWLLLVIVAMVGWLLFYRKFLAHLPRLTLMQFSIAILFYGAAFVVDKLDKRLSSTNLSPTDLSVYGTAHSIGLGSIVDEILELIGLIMFIYALLSYMSMSLKELRIYITRDPSIS